MKKGVAGPGSRPLPGLKGEEESLFLEGWTRGLFRLVPAQGRAFKFLFLALCVLALGFKDF